MNATTTEPKIGSTAAATIAGSDKPSAPVAEDLSQPRLSSPALSLDQVITQEQVEIVQRIHDASAELLRCLKQGRDFQPPTAATSKGPALAPRPTTRKTILVVDDEKSFREILKHILEEEGYEVTEAVNGKDGIEKLDTLKPNLILLDLCLPDIDGWDVIRHVKESPSLNRVKVLALSGLSLNDGQVAALRSLTWGFLPKADFTVSLMRRRLAELLGPR